MSRPFKTLLTIDFETFWDSKEYTLSKMTTEEYIRDKRFKPWGACIHEYGTDKITQWYHEFELPRVLATYDWSTTAVLAHNAQFDVSILEWRYGVHPCFIFDTLSMARALRGVEVGNSLAKLAEDFGLPAKGKAVHSTDGLTELSSEIMSELVAYCMHDVFLCEEVFRRLSDGYPTRELRLIDITLKMYTRAQLQLDANMLTDALLEERETREGLLQRLGATDADLASNDRFAQLLRSIGCTPPTKKKRPTPKTPNPVGENYAFAKTDAMFQAMLNGDREDVALLCEARLKVKSTTERTRAQRFLDISQRGPLPVPLSYYGAITGRYTASKGSALNMQNLKRGSFLRKAIMAPAGQVIVVGDLSQIEPRVLAWLADYEDMLRIFRQGADPYAAFGAEMFNKPGMTKESDPSLRQSAKSALLGCFGPDTPVLTNRGWIPIVRVQATDMVWDGAEWVCHQGVVPQGEKDVLTAWGISATSDHEILTERGWVEWSEALTDRSLLQQATFLANLPVSDGSAAPKGRSGNASLATNQRCGALADGKALLSGLTFGKAEQHGVTTALKRRQRLRAWLGQGLKQCAQMLHTGIACLTASAPSLLGAQTQTALRIQTTVGAASSSILHGWLTALSFYATSLASKAGTPLPCRSTGSITTKGTYRETCASLQEVSTWRTNEKSKRVMSNGSNERLNALKQRMLTYDIAYAGPRNRYTILTSAGPLVVHNCGYGLGWASFASQLLVGFLGAPPVRYDVTFAKALGITAKDVEDFVAYEPNVMKMQEMAYTCTFKELVVHCVAAKAIIDKYRATATPVAALWKLLGNLIEYSLYGGTEYTHKCLTFRKEEIVLPSGMSMRYPDLRPEKDDKGKVQWTYGPDRTKLYGGKLANNITQGTARCVMTDGMVRVAPRYFVAGTVHDELLALAPEEDAAAAKTWVLAQMVVEPKYLPGIPLAADGGVHRRYGEAKQ